MSRTAGPSHPCSMAYLTKNMPARAIATAPSQTIHRTVRASSNLPTAGLPNGGSGVNVSGSVSGGNSGSGSCSASKAVPSMGVGVSPVVSDGGSATRSGVETRGAVATGVAGSASASGGKRRWIRNAETSSRSESSWSDNPTRSRRTARKSDWFRCVRLSATKRHDRDRNGEGEGKQGREANTSKHAGPSKESLPRIMAKYSYCNIDVWKIGAVRPAICRAMARSCAMIGRSGLFRLPVFASGGRFRRRQLRRCFNHRRSPGLADRITAGRLLRPHNRRLDSKRRRTGYFWLCFGRTVNIPLWQRRRRTQLRTDIICQTQKRLAIDAADKTVSKRSSLTVNHRDIVVFRECRRPPGRSGPLADIER